MRYIRIAVVALFFVSVVAQGQNNEVFTFTKELNQLYKANSGKLFDALRVVEDVKLDSVLAASTKTQTKEYNNALASFKKAKSDSINARKKNSSKRNDNNENAEIAKVKSNIKSFLNSAKNYDEKKSLLKEAQIIAAKYGMNHLIYADANVNSSKKSKFFVMSRNSLDLKVHLKRILPKINIPEKKVVVKDESPSYAAVDVARKKLKNTNRYKITKGSVQVTKSSNIKAGALIFKPENVIVGSFKNKGVYYVTATGDDVTNNLLTEAEVKSQGLSPNSLPYKYAFNIIQNLNTNKMFLVSTDFVKRANASTNSIGSSN